MRPRELFVVARATFATSGRPVLLRAIALGMPLLAVGLVIFSSSGMRPREFVDLLHASLAARLVAWSIWTALLAPVVQPAFDAPGTLTLRALRLPRAPRLASLLALFFVAEVPPIVLFARGGGLVEAISFASLGVALAVSHPLRRRRVPWFLAAALLVVFDPPRILVAPLAALLAPIAIDRAWRSAVEGDPGAVRMTRPTNPFFAVTLTHLLKLARDARARLAMGAFACASGGAALFLSLRNAPTTRPIARALVVFSFPVAIAAAALVTPLVEVEAQLRALFRSTRTRALTALAAFSAALVLPTSAFAATSSAVASVGVHAHATALPFAIAAWTLPLGAAIAWWGRRRADKPAVFAFGVIVIAAIAMGVAW